MPKLDATGWGLLCIAAGFMLTQVFRGIAVVRRIMDAANRAEEAARRAELARDPLDVEKASREALDALSKATRSAEMVRAIPIQPATDISEAMQKLQACGETFIFSNNYGRGKPFRVSGTGAAYSCDGDVSETPLEAINSFLSNVNKMRAAKPTYTLAS